MSLKTKCSDPPDEETNGALSTANRSATPILKELHFYPINKFKYQMNSLDIHIKCNNDSSHPKIQK